MQINNIQHNSFKSGLTKQILEKEACINPKKVENYFKNSPYCRRYMFENLDLKNNKAYAVSVRMCAEIFKNFSKKHKYNDMSYITPQVFPADIIVFNKEDLADSLSDKEKKDYMENFRAISSHCFKNEPIFKNQKHDIRIGTILIPNIFESLKEINETANATSNKNNHFHSSNHFLNLFVHEWIHSLSDHYLYRETDGCTGCNYKATAYYHKQKKLDDKERQIVNEVLGEYCSNVDENQYSEVSTEAWTKFICDSLDKDGVHFKKDPIEVMKKTPKEFREILKKVSTIEIRNYDYLTGETKPSNRHAICFHPMA